jgi:hypothetical protein
MIVQDNWSEGQVKGAPDPNGTNGTGIAYSIILRAGANTKILRNNAQGFGAGIGIELDGPGEIAGNYMDAFDYGAIVYGAGFYVHDNVFVNTPLAAVPDYNNGAKGGTIQNNIGRALNTLRPPERRIWPP